MKSKFKKAKLRFSKDFLQSNKQKSLFKRGSQHLNLWLKNRQSNTFANWHHSMDENSTKINVFKIALQSKAAMKALAMKTKRSKRQIPRKCQSTTFMKQRSGWSQKAVLSRKQKVSKSKINTKIEFNLPTLMKQSSQDS